MTAGQLARLAGAIYLLQAFVGSFPLYVRSKLIVPHDAAATFDNVIHAETLFRLGMLSEVGVSITWFSIAFILYLLLRRVREDLSLLFMVIVAIGATCILANVARLTGGLEVLLGNVATPGFDHEQLTSSAMMLFTLFGRGEAVWALLAGIWLIPLGYVLRQSRYVPRPFGPLLMVASLGYILPVMASITLPEYAAPLRRLIFLSGPVEMSFGLWLLVKGVPSNMEGLWPVYRGA